MMKTPPKVPIGSILGTKAFLPPSFQMYFIRNCFLVYFAFCQSLFCCKLLSFFIDFLFLCSFTLGSKYNRLIKFMSDFFWLNHLLLNVCSENPVYMSLNPWCPTPDGSIYDIDSVERIIANRSPKSGQNNSNRGLKSPKWYKLRQEITNFAEMMHIAPNSGRGQINANKIEPTAQGATTTLLGDGPGLTYFPSHLT